MGSEIDEVLPRNCVTGFQMTQNLLRAEQIAEEFNRNLKLIVSEIIDTEEFASVRFPQLLPETLMNGKNLHSFLSQKTHALFIGDAVEMHDHRCDNGFFAGKTPDLFRHGTEMFREFFREGLAVGIAREFGIGMGARRSQEELSSHSLR